MKKTIVSLILALSLSVSAFAFTGCGEQDTALLDAYNAYVSSLSEDATALSYDEWLTLIKSGDTFTNESDLDAIYSSYSSTYGENAMSFNDWKASITSFGAMGASIEMIENGQILLTFKNGNTLLISFDEVGRIGEVVKDIGLSFYNENNRVYLSANESVATSTFTVPEYAYRYVIFTTTTSGVYRISTGTKTIKRFNASSFYAQVDENNVPTDVIAISGVAPNEDTNPSLYTGNDYIEIEIKNSDLGQSFFFMVSAEDTKEEFTVTATKVGNAKTEVYLSETVEAETTYATSQIPLLSGTETVELVAVDGSAVIVYNDTDKLYHVGSATGPLLMVQMNNAIARVSITSIKDVITALDAPNSDAISPFRTSVTVETENTITTTTYNYEDAVRSYLAMANSQGMCHVDKTMMAILKAYIPKTEGSVTTADEYEWLLPCSYIVEA